jgi:phosphoenolpyruvate carboxylase
MKMPAMSRSDIHFPPKDLPLREDVSTFGALVGEVLKEQGGAALFERVEAARTAAIRRRKGDVGGEEALCAAVCSLTPAEAEELVRAFAAYFQVVNLVEKAHRIRRRRDHQRATAPQEGSPEHTLRLLAEAGLDRAGALRLLGELLYEPVFTAHPTEAVRRTILEKQQRILMRLAERFDPSRTPPEERAALARIRAEVTAGWQTAEHPKSRPRVADEREHVLFFITRVLYRAIPVFYEEYEAAVEAVYPGAGLPPEDEDEAPPSSPSSPSSPALPVMIRFASWVGGDMDGNPNVSAATIRETLKRHRLLILRLYRAECTELARRLSQSLSRVAVAPAIEERIARYGESFPHALEAIRPRYRAMPYRTLLWLMDARLAATQDDAPGGYLSAGELAEDLRAIIASLLAHRGEHAGVFGVRRWLRRVETFGFHLATLDVRQDSLVHRRVVGELLGDERWLERPAGERAERLRQALQAVPAPLLQSSTVPQPSDEAAATLEVFRAIGDCQQRYGAVAIGPFIISMAQAADDVLSVLLLARWAGPTEAADGTPETVPQQVPLDVAPLFETVPDLEAAPAVLRELTGDPFYRQHLAARGDRQVVMIGYSDSNKDGGLAASRWALQKGQAALVASLAAAGIELTLFHGRGGTISRGGGKTRRAVLAAPRGSVAGRLRVTEQGEVINAKFGVRAIALRTLEQATSAVALATAMPRLVAAEEEREPRWHSIMEEIAGQGRRVYRALVYEDPAFVDYFRHATPIDVIERMTIGSRPASRRSGGGVENLRAIPWVFAWTQSRHLLPGWYGVGTALAAAIERHGLATMAEMVRDWPFAGALVDDVEMVLAKADLGIAERYAALAPASGPDLFAQIRAEFDRTVATVLALKGSTDLLDQDPTLQRSIRLRNPYVDPMSLLQVDLLARWRAADRRDDALFAALLATVNGIAQGLQNTG